MPLLSRGFTARLSRCRSHLRPGAVCLGRVMKWWRLVSYFLLVGAGTRVHTSTQLERAPELLFIRYKSQVSHFYTFPLPGRGSFPLPRSLQTCPGSHETQGKFEAPWNEGFGPDGLELSHHVCVLTLPAWQATWFLTWKWASCGPLHVAACRCEHNCAAYSKTVVVAEFDWNPKVSFPKHCLPQLLFSCMPWHCCH